MRQKLQTGSCVWLSDSDVQQKFYIDALIGEGASCIAYDAHWIDRAGAKVCCRIKECYPICADIQRSGETLVWTNADEKSRCCLRFRQMHDVIQRLKDCPDVGNNITGARLWKGNGTWYSVMDVNYGTTYDQICGQTLEQIIDTVLILTRIVGKLHAQSFLHLDIKPSNFLVCYSPNTWAWLFDVDSLISIEDVKTQKAQTNLYSQAWAAPEQICGKPHKLCPATDLYAIGAIYG